ncbi:YbaB/EbfC family nucleoid-associated protein [Micromonospora zamorensis]|uniref:YbaB/EbfC family nucleoid-associated protein n=1 Tax=Micromonospora zamorensis TaxID=709883 RepID=UPI0008201520|nr:YbaB/EbfC family nucleoid-associated protein [Micromonospora zamorensis]SCG69493.1 YbaB/EbfC DNA-binding family protein [Micromonospora zamorensis]
MTADADQFRQSMDDALDTLRELRANRPSAEELVRIRGEATAADGLIAVVASPGGRVESITVAPQVLRQGSGYLAEQLTIAVNAALDDLQARTVAEAPDTPSPAVLLDRLADVQQQSVHQMQSFLSALTSAQARTARPAG